MCDNQNQKICMFGLLQVDYAISRHLACEYHYNLTYIVSHIIKGMPGIFKWTSSSTLLMHKNNMTKFILLYQYTCT